MTVDEKLDLIIELLESRPARVRAPKPAPPAVENTPTGVSPALFLDILVASGKVLGEGYDPDTFGTIGKKLNKIGVDMNDVEKFRTWVESGGLNWIKDPFTWNSLCRAPKFLLLDWVARARAYTKPDPAPAQLTLPGFDFKSFMRAEG